MNGTWYREGAHYPPQTPGRMTFTVVVYECRNGKWIVPMHFNAPG